MAQDNSMKPTVPSDPLYFGNQGLGPQTVEMGDFQNISSNPTQSTVVTITSDEPPIRDHLVWSIFNTVYMNVCCLGLLALVFSVKTRDRKIANDRNASMSYSSTARALNISATVLSILLFIILITVYSVMLRSAISI
ncbi:dispanin subfamily A member 2b-like [Rhinophrynus dorsalis]